MKEKIICNENNNNNNNNKEEEGDQGYDSLPDRYPSLSLLPPLSLSLSLSLFLVECSPLAACLLY